MLPLFLLILLATMYLVDVVRARLRAHELARYGAFASAHMALRDYAEETPITVPFLGTLYGRKASAIGALQLHTSTYARRELALGKSIVGDFGDAQVSLAASPFSYVPMNTAAEILDSLGESDAASIVSTIGDVLHWTLSLLFDYFGFEGAPTMTATATIPIDFHVPWEYLGYKPGDAGKMSRARIEEKVSVISDSWALGDGSDVWAGGYPGSRVTLQRLGEAAPMQKQVDRMYLLKGLIAGEVGDSIKGFMGAFTEVLSFFVSSDPLGKIDAARVTMKNYGLTGATATTGMIDVFENLSKGLEGLEPGEFRWYDTTQMRDDPENEGANSRHLRGLRNRGPYFMGCPHSQDPRCRVVR